MIKLYQITCNFSRFTAIPIDYTVNYYKALHIPESATQAQIRIAFYKLSQHYNPNQPTGNADKYRNLVQAYNVLSNVELKEKYDRKREYQPVEYKQKVEPTHDIQKPTQPTSDSSSINMNQGNIVQIDVTVKMGEIQHTFKFDEKYLDNTMNQSQADRVVHEFMKDFINNKGGIKQHLEKVPEKSKSEEIVDIGLKLIGFILTVLLKKK